MTRVGIAAIEEFLHLLVAEKSTFEHMKRSGKKREEIYESFRSRVTGLEEWKIYELVRNLGREFRKANEKASKADGAAELKLRGSTGLYTAYAAFHSVYFCQERPAKPIVLYTKGEHIKDQQMRPSLLSATSDYGAAITGSAVTSNSHVVLEGCRVGSAANSLQDRVRSKMMPDGRNRTHHFPTLLSPTRPRASARLSRSRKRKHVTAEEEAMTKSELERVLLLEQINESRYRQDLIKKSTENIMSGGLNLIGNLISSVLQPNLGEFGIQNHFVESDNVCTNLHVDS